MTFKDKLSYIAEYYKYHIIGIILTIFIVFSTYKIMLKEDPILTAYFINSGISYENSKNLKDEFLTYINADKKDELILDTSMIIDISNDENIIGFEYFMKISAMISSSYIDILISDRPILDHFISVGFSSNIKDMLNSDIYNKLKDYVIYKDDTPIAIDISNAPIIQKYAPKNIGMFLSIPQNATNINNITLFLKFIFDL